VRLFFCSPLLEIRPDLIFDYVISNLFNGYCGLNLVHFGEILLKLKINGENRKILKSQNLEDLIRELDIQAPNFAIALNQQVVPKSKYATTPVQENDEVEIVQAVGGGI
jgi:sulfur carrier protein